MEHKTVHVRYLGYSVHRNNIDKLEEWLSSFTNMRNRRRLLWITPNNRKTLKIGDMIIVDYKQDQISEGDEETFLNSRDPLAVYSSSNIRRSWRRGQRFMEAGVYIMHQETPVI